MLGRLIKRALHRLVRFAIRAPAVAAIVALLLLGGAGYLILQSGPELPGLSVSLPGPSHAPSSTENYLKGTQSYNAELMWTSLSDEALDRYRTRGLTIQDMQQQLDLARDRGTRFEQIDYVGGRPLPDGTSLQFYVVTSRGPGARAETEYVTYIFTLDRSGKISKVQ